MTKQINKQHVVLTHTMYASSIHHYNCSSFWNGSWSLEKRILFTSSIEILGNPISTVLTRKIRLLV